MAKPPPGETSGKPVRRVAPLGASGPTLLFAAPAGLLTAFLAVPVLALILRGLTAPHLWLSATNPLVLEALRLTLTTTSLTLLIVLLAGTPLAYLLARRRFRGRAVLQTIVDLPLALPPMVAGVALLMAFGRAGLLGTQLAIIGLDLPFTTAAVVMAQTFVATPFFVRSARLGFGAIERSVEEAALMDGAGFRQTFFHILLPLARPGLSGGAVLCLGRALSEFGATLLFAGNFEGRTQTMSLAIFQALQSDLSAALVLAVVLVAVSGTVLVVSQLVGNRPVE